MWIHLFDTVITVCCTFLHVEYIILWIDVRVLSSAVLMPLTWQSKKLEMFKNFTYSAWCSCAVQPLFYDFTTIRHVYKVIKTAHVGITYLKTKSHRVICF